MKNQHLRIVALLLTICLVADPLSAACLALQEVQKPAIQEVVFDAQALHLRGTWFFHNSADSSDVIRHRSAWIHRFSLEQKPVDSSLPGSEYGERFFPYLHDPQVVFDAWLRNTEHYQAPSGSRVMTVDNNPSLDRLAAFYIANLMIAFINQRKLKYGVGWVSLIRNYGNTVKGQWHIWATDPAFKYFPWESVYILGGDNVIFGTVDSDKTPAPVGSAEEHFLPMLTALQDRGLRLEYTFIVQGDFNGPQDPRIPGHIENYYTFLPQRIRELSHTLQDPERQQTLEQASTTAAPDIMQLGLPRGPDEKFYYGLLNLFGRIPVTRFIAWRIAALSASVHLWFNETFSSHDSRMRVVRINPFTNRVNTAKYQQTRGFQWAISLGLGDVQTWARFNVVFGDKGKESALHMILFGPLSRFLPASVLQRVPEKTVFFVSKGQEGARPTAPPAGVKLPDGSPYRIFELLYFTLTGKEVSPYQIQPLTRGRAEGGTLSEETIRRDLNTLVYLGLADPIPGDLYKAKDIDEKQWRNIEILLRELGPRPSSAQKRLARASIQLRLYFGKHSLPINPTRTDILEWWAKHRSSVRRLVGRQVSLRHVLERLFGPFPIYFEWKAAYHQAPIMDFVLDHENILASAVRRALYKLNRLDFTPDKLGGLNAALTDLLDKDRALRRQLADSAPAPQPLSKIVDQFVQLPVGESLIGQWFAQKLQIKWFKSEEDLSQEAAVEVIHTITQKLDAALMLPTGETPKRMYQILVEKAQNGLIDFRQVKIFIPEAFVGGTDFKDYMYEQFIDRLPANNRPTVYAMGNLEGRMDEQPEAFEQKIREVGGIDLAVVGTGTRGRLGFNRDGTPFNSLSHEEELAPSTLLLNRHRMRAAYTHGLTAGLGTYLGAKRIVAIASGPRKTYPLSRLLYGKPTDHVPLTALLYHDNAVLLMDEAAAPPPDRKGEMIEWNDIVAMTLKMKQVLAFKGVHVLDASLWGAEEPDQTYPRRNLRISLIIDGPALPEYLDSLHALWGSSAPVELTLNSRADFISIIRAVLPDADADDVQYERLRNKEGSGSPEAVSILLDRTDTPAPLSTADTPEIHVQPVGQPSVHPATPRSKLKKLLKKAPLLSLFLFVLPIDSSAPAGMPVGMGILMLLIGYPTLIMSTVVWGILKFGNSSDPQGDKIRARWSLLIMLLSGATILTGYILMGMLNWSSILWPWGLFVGAAAMAAHFGAGSSSSPIIHFSNDTVPLESLVRPLITPSKVAPLYFVDSAPETTVWWDNNQALHISLSQNVLTLALNPQAGAVANTQAVTTELNRILSRLQDIPAWPNQIPVTKGKSWETALRKALRGINAVITRSFTDETVSTYSDAMRALFEAATYSFDSTINRFSRLGLIPRKQWGAVHWIRLFNPMLEELNMFALAPAGWVVTISRRRRLEAKRIRSYLHIQDHRGQVLLVDAVDPKNDILGGGSFGRQVENILIFDSARTARRIRSEYDRAVALAAEEGMLWSDKILKRVVALTYDQASSLTIHNLIKSIWSTYQIKEKIDSRLPQGKEELEAWSPEHVVRSIFSFSTPSPLVPKVINSLLHSYFFKGLEGNIHIRDYAQEVRLVLELLLTAPSPMFQQMILSDLFEQIEGFHVRSENYQKVAENIVFPLVEYVKEMIPPLHPIKTNEDILNYLVTIAPQTLWELLDSASASTPATNMPPAQKIPGTGTPFSEGRDLRHAA